MNPEIVFPQWFLLFMLVVPSLGVLLLAFIAFSKKEPIFFRGLAVLGLFAFPLLPWRSAYLLWPGVIPWPF